MFPQMGVLANHPNYIDHFSIETHGDFGGPPFQETPISGLNL